MNFKTAQELLALCTEMPISEVMIAREMVIANKSREQVFESMRHSYSIMKRAINTSLTENLVSMGGLIGGEAKKVYARRKNSICGDLMSCSIAYAMGVLEVNASMGLIVAAPTAGASGVIPGVFLALQETHNLPDDAMVQALFNAGAIGYLITRNGTVSGAEGGCQAEVGTASAMAASAVVELMGGAPAECLSAAGTAISNILGMVCDPIAGLVEAPCQKRNALGASNALISAEIGMCQVGDQIPFDEIVEVMYKVGRSIPYELRETALGGLASAPSACGLCPSCNV
ncbi:L-serine ammonia-lyase, iron-sulfur-dependent, subunit alpha [Candidatus Epulonipiscium viviparus]|uniref:L-serine ammonia-lyase, iron-sulfur-dependent, subunit alpha n=1 Tax=Candidatus Epulonipiscium viviparus TaxID=420336 RepID=UPI0027381589|nr:L-serine ammonia-lyase, iron-sulfur-dependent, subunit alpha [Candidatus Epulopiscium viviparus]